MNRGSMSSFTKTSTNINKIAEVNHLEQFLSKYYLSKAQLNYRTNDQSNDWCTVGYATAQGWRPTQEDAHLVDLNISPNQGKRAFTFFFCF